MKVLIIEDEKELSDDISGYLSGEEYVCEQSPDMHDALDRIHNHDYDCIILDLMLPDGTGLTVLEELKKLHKNDGVIIISAKNATDDKIRGLQIGADDYLAKPFHLAELAARVHSIIRRRQFVNRDVIEVNEMRIDLQSRQVFIHGESVLLTKKEFDLLLFFVGNKNRVLSKAALAEHLSGDFADMFDSHDFVYAHIKNLKRKLSEHNYGGYIHSVYGVGYKWSST